MLYVYSIHTHYEYEFQISSKIHSANMKLMAPKGQAEAPNEAYSSSQSLRGWLTTGKSHRAQ